MAQFSEALELINLKIIKYDQSKQRPISTNRGTMNVEKFCEMMKKELAIHAIEFPAVWKALQDTVKAEKMLMKYSEENKLLRGGKMDVEIPPDMKGLTLNMDLSAKGKEDRFFLTNPNETVSHVSGDSYLMLHQLTPLEASNQARKVVPEYIPRGPRGVSEIRKEGITKTIFNVYTPPVWEDHKHWEDLPDSLPPLFKKLIIHLFPLREEQRYFLSWLHDSLFSRAFVFLILCGDPGVGKNRLKLVLRGLHGHSNSIDGKKSTLVERFNSQLGEATLAWFDELHYDAGMENTMKELQNDSISIERKGVDATRATKIYSSIAISNNKPRDNYIAFDARKFVPLVLTKRRLETSMTPEEIDELTKKVEDPTSEFFDPKFLAQIAKWLKRRGKSKKWPNLEYKGPMFWTLAHTSMTRWQKILVMILLDPAERTTRNGFNEEKQSFLWSELHSKVNRKNKESGVTFPDFTSVKAFLEIFRDGTGKQAFSTEEIPDNIMGDFYVKPLLEGKTKILTELSVAEQRMLHNATKKTETDDL